MLPSEECLGCEGKFTPKYSAQKFCSLSCANKCRTYVRITQEKTCLNCNVVFIVDCTNNVKIHCSRSCAATYNNRMRRACSPCLGCGVEIPHNGKGKRGGKFWCSPKCRTNKRIQDWLVGDEDGTVKTGLAKALRTYLLKKAQYKCQDGRSGCNGWSGFNPKSGKSCLTVDHVDGNVYNNRPENLVVMCPNCHSMTETYGALNKGSGRAFRYMQT
jgi:hypothetical protein